MSRSLNYLQSLLVREGLCPPCQSVDELDELTRSKFSFIANLLPLLQQAWTKSDLSAKPLSRHRRAKRLTDWLQSTLDTDSQLALGLPGIAGWRFLRLMGDRLVWWPRGIPEKQWIGVVSSRLKRPAEVNDRWFRALRRVCNRLDKRTEMLLVSRRSTAGEYVQRCCELFGTDAVLLDVAPDNRNWRAWFDSCVAGDHDTNNRNSRIWPASVSPPIWRDGDCSAPARDRAVVAAGSRLVALKVSLSGNIFDLLVHRLNETLSATCSLTVMVGDGLTSLKTYEKLRAFGTRNVGILDEVETSFRGRRPVAVAKSQSAHIEQFSANNRCRPGCLGIDLSDLLTHCTRQQNGPWPDELRDQYLDHLILGQRQSDHSAFATLRRIITLRKLIATGTTIRSGIKTVCFTAVPLDEIHELRQFRVHRGRWDFEPYGICIRKGWLEDRDAKPVRYIDESRSRYSEPEDRPFVQPRLSGKRNEINWSVEREWRHLGDLDLRQLPDDSAVVFVPTKAEAGELATSCPWPILVVGRQWAQDKT